MWSFENLLKDEERAYTLVLYGNWTKAGKALMWAEHPSYVPQRQLNTDPVLNFLFPGEPAAPWYRQQLISIDIQSTADLFLFSFSYVVQSAFSSDILYLSRAPVSILFLKMIEVNSTQPHEIQYVFPPS